jgi:hypothetical protein
MGLFDQVMNVIQDPNREASMGQIGQILSAAQQVAQTHNTDSATMQQTLSMVGGFVQSALKETQANRGPEAAQALIQQGASGGAVQLFSPAQQQQISQAISQKTGLNANQIQAMLPMLIPLVMKFLNQGSAKTDAAAGDNPLLNAFLDTDGDGDVDMGDMLTMAGKFM